MKNMLLLLAACLALVFLCLTDLSALPGVLLLSLLVYFFSFRWVQEEPRKKKELAPVVFLPSPAASEGERE